MSSIWRDEKIERKLWDQARRELKVSKRKWNKRVKLWENLGLINPDYLENMLTKNRR